MATPAVTREFNENVSGEQRSLAPAAIAVGFAVLCLSWMLNAMDRQVFYPLLPEIREDFGFTLEESGFLATGFTVGLAVAGFLAGFVVDRFSRKTVIVGSVLVYSLGTLAIPLSSGLYDMAAYRIVSGVGEGVQATALYAVVGSFFFHRRAFAAGFVGVAFGAGIFLGPMIGVPFATAFDSWRAPFFLFGGLGLVMVTLILVAVSRRMSEARAGTVAAAAQDYSHVPASPYNRNTLGFGIACVVSGTVFYGFMGLYPTFLREELGFDPAQAAFAVSMSGLGAMMALPAGWLGDRFSQKWLLAGTFVGTALVGYLMYAVVTGEAGQYVLSFLMGTLASGFLFTNCSTAMQRSVRPESVGRGQGLFMLTYYVAAAFSGLLFAKLVAAVGWSGAGMWQLAGASLLGAVALMLVRPDQMLGKR
ncbi:MFS transporter [Georgenia sp. SUBG003]|uniref:MFS transporter n=1 Tax=Georgenia sp. SUBG003 TaxID=1497974 RepID=UPI0004D4A768|nr:MFS transporter [Georgenia sp. SUBG003]